MPPRGLAAIIFDLDGTLIDSVDLYYRILSEVFRRVGLPQPQRQQVLQVMAQGITPWEALVPAQVPDRESLISRCKEIDAQVWDELFPQVSPLPGALAVLSSLKAAGLRLGIATSSWQAEETLRLTGIAPFIDALVSYEDGLPRKPAPDMLLECCRRLGVAPSQTLYVGDSPADLQAGKAAGITTVAVTSGASGQEALARDAPEAILEEVGGLLELLKLEDRGKNCDGL
jgi:HAD superfamily hydrolase (TIGR01509 family)